MSVAFFGPSQLFALPTTMQVQVSTLHGTIITVPLQPSMLVSLFKQQCIETSPFHLIPLSVNADLAYMMRNCNLDDLIGIRVSTWDGQLLDDGKSIGSQVKTLDTLFKLVFMKQYDLDQDDLAMMREFAGLGHRNRLVASDTRPSGLIVTMPLYQTQMVVMPVFGGAGRRNHLLGILYQHSETQRHVQLQECGVDPSVVDPSCPVTRAEFVPGSGNTGRQPRLPGVYAAPVLCSWHGQNFQEDCMTCQQIIAEYDESAVAAAPSAA